VDHPDHSQEAPIHQVLLHPYPHLQAVLPEALLQAAVAREGDNLK
jgi:hypothetical protein